MVQLNFDASQVEPSTGGGGQLPVSDDNGHLVVIKSSIMKATKEKDGEYLELTLEIIEGPQKGASGPYRLNLRNKSADSVRIANAQLSAICHVTGIFQVAQSEQLHNIPFRAVVKPQNDPKYTEVTAVKDVNGNAPGQQSRQGPAQPASQGQPQNWGGQQGQAPQGNGGGWGNGPANAGTGTGSDPASMSQGGGNPSNNGQTAPSDASPSNGQQTPPWGAPQGGQPAAGGTPPWAAGGQQ